MGWFAPLTAQLRVLQVTFGLFIMIRWETSGESWKQLLLQFKIFGPFFFVWLKMINVSGFTESRRSRGGEMSPP